MRRRERRRAPQRAAQQPGGRPRRRPGQHQHGCERRPARVQAERQRHACPPARPVSGSSLARAGRRHLCECDSTSECAKCGAGMLTPLPPYSVTRKLGAVWSCWARLMARWAAQARPAGAGSGRLRAQRPAAPGASWGRRPQAARRRCEAPNAGRAGQGGRPAALSREACAVTPCALRSSATLHGYGW